MWEEKKTIEGLTGKQILRQKAINRYYDNPIRCKNCNNIIKIPIGEKVADTRRKQFCNHSCSASYNNIGKTRHGDSSRYICECGNKKSRDSISCHSCKIERTWNVQQERTLGDIISKGNARVKWATLRELAKRALQRAGIEEKCKLCSFKYPDVCHIKGINEFDDTSLVKEVNSLENLIYLCPNHHRLLDKNLLSL